MAAELKTSSHSPIPEALKVPSAVLKKRSGSYREKQISSEAESLPHSSNGLNGSEVSEDNGPVTCPCTSHEGKVILDFTIPLSVDHVYSLVFADSSKFFNDLHISRKTTDLVCTNWEECDDETGDKIRQLTYTVLLKSSLAKTAVSKESQRMLQCSKSGCMYIVDSTILNQGVPYSDSFCIQTRTCLTRVSNQQCHFMAYSKIGYLKSVFGLVKSIIERSAMSGVIDFSEDLEAALKQVAEGKTHSQASLPTSTSSSSSSTTSLNGKNDIPKRVRIAEMQEDKLLTSNTPNPPPTIIVSPASSVRVVPVSSEVETSTFSKVPVELFVKISIGVLVVLLFLNILLFLKMSSIEDFSVKLSITPDDGISIPIGRLPHLSQKDFLRLLTHQEQLHRAEIDSWVEVINKLVDLFTLTQKSLFNLQKGVESYKTSRLIHQKTDDKSL